MTTVAVTSASVGTKLATGADTKITGITMAAPTAYDPMPLVLVDQAALPASAAAAAVPARTLYHAGASVLTFVYGIKPNGPSVAPGLVAPTFPMSLGAMAIAFTNGVFVRGCPTGVTFNVTTG